MAFVAVSTAMLGAGLGAQWVSLRPTQTPQASRLRIERASVLFALLVPLAQLISQYVQFDPFDLRSQFCFAAPKMAVLYIALALPFALSAAAIAEALGQSRHNDSLFVVYAADLVGAAFGSLAALLLIPTLAGTGPLWVASGMGMFSAMLLCAHRARRLGYMFAAAFAILVAYVAPLPLVIMKSKQTANGESFAKVFSDTRRHRGTYWTTQARIDRVRLRRGHERLVIDAGVAAVRVPPRKFKPYLSDVTLPYELHSQARVLVVGAGAGWEVAEARALGAQHVVGVEINPAILLAVPATIRADRAVSLIRDDARSYLESPGPTFDIITMIHTISNAATTAGALELTEDHLLTVEAFRKLFERLNPNGYLLITRPSSQIPRLIQTLQAAFNPVPLKSRIAVWQGDAQDGFYSGILLGRQPLPYPRILDRLHSRQLKVLYPPSTAANGAANTEDFSKLQSSHTKLRTDPPTDDAPFFHRRRHISHLFSSIPRKPLQTARLALENLPLAELALLILLVESSLLAGLLLLGPLWRRSSEVRLSIRPALGFAVVGLAFVLIEIALIQRIGLLIGDPTRSMAISFAGLLFGAGTGSWVAQRSSIQHQITQAALGSILFGSFSYTLVRVALGYSLGMRVAVSSAVALILGFMLGGVLPTALTHQSHKYAVAEAFALNSVASVVGTSIALLIAPEIGLSGLCISAGMLYALAGVLIKTSKTDGF